MVLDGTQMTGEARESNEQGNAAKLSSFYDVDRLLSTAREHGIEIATQDTLVEQFPDFDRTHYRATCGRAGPFMCQHHLREVTKNHQHISLRCPFPEASVSPWTVRDNPDAVHALLDSLQPSPGMKDIIDKTLTNLRRICTKSTSTSDYNFIHLRIEDDWVKHCQTWSRFGDNCLNHTTTIGSQVLGKGWDSGTRVYVATSWEQLEHPLSLKAEVMQELVAAGLKVITRMDVLPSEAAALQREQLAMIEYYVGLHSAKSTGNSVASFSAVLLLERWRHKRWATYYNGGDVPMAVFLPLYRLPWVFVYSAAHDGDLTLQVQLAVHSAMRAKLLPVCIYIGDTAGAEDPMLYWLERHGVEIVLHAPAWEAELATTVEAANGQLRSQGRSELRFDAILADVVAVDLPVIPELMMHNFVMSTAPSVLFKAHLGLLSFPSKPLPLTVGMSRGLRERPLMLHNQLNLRDSHASAVEAVLADVSRLGEAPEDARYGHILQGVFSRIYADTESRYKMPHAFNAHIDHRLAEGAVVVHIPPGVAVGIPADPQGVTPKLTPFTCACLREEQSHGADEITENLLATELKEFCSGTDLRRGRLRLT